jgi:hypothetical protein
MEQMKELVRRLDWRFLLATPRLCRVAYLGVEDTVLKTALSVFCERLKVIASSDLRHDPVDMPDAGADSVDVLVAGAAFRGEVESALTMLAPGGELYWELPRERSVLRRDWAGLDDLGLVARTYWHYPNFEECELIVPLRQPGALAWAVRRRVRSAAFPLVSFAARAAARSDLLARVLPAVSVVAQKMPLRGRGAA